MTNDKTPNQPTEESGTEVQVNLIEEYEPGQKRHSSGSGVEIRHYDNQSESGIEIYEGLSQSFAAMHSIVENYEKNEGPKELKPNQSINRFQLECDEIYLRMAKDFDCKLERSIDPDVTQAIEAFHQIIRDQDINQHIAKLDILALMINGKLYNIMSNEDESYFDLLESDEETQVAINPRYAHFKQLRELDKMCTQLRLQLQLRHTMNEWQNNVNANKETPLTQLKSEIENTFNQMIPSMHDAHPLTINLLNRCHMEAHGWLEAKQLMEEYKNLEDLLGATRHIPIGRKRTIWLKKRDQCYAKLQQLALELGQNFNTLINYTELADYNARKPFSLEWFIAHSQNIDSQYFNQETQELTPNGLKQIDDLISEALHPFIMEVGFPKNIEQPDLVLIAHYLGRENMEKYCQIFELHGDGTENHQFTMDNLRSILIGMAADRKRGFEEEHIKNLLNKVEENARNPTLRLGSSPRLINAYDNRMQNALPKYKENKWYHRNIFYNFLRWAREYSYSVVATSNERFAASYLAAGDPTFILVMALFAGLTHAKMDNDPACAYKNKLLRVLANNPKPPEAQQYLSSGTEAKKKILENLVASANFQDFSRVYPMFADENAHLAEVAALKNYYIERTDETIPSTIQSIIEKKVYTMEKLARCERISHGYAYLYANEKEHLEFDLQDRDLNPMRYAAKNIIDPKDTGFGVTFYSPVAGQKIHNNTIPLIIMFPGTHNQPGILRDLDPISPGKSDWSNPKHKKAFLKELNKEIERLKQEHPGTEEQPFKISIELLGHSLGGSDALQAELLILEAMGQHMLTENPDLVVQYQAKIDATFTDADQDELNHLKTQRTNVRRIERLEYQKNAKKRLQEGLESALALNGRKRHYSVIDKDEDRSIEEAIRNNINHENISVVSTFCNRGAGIGDSDAYATSALMGLITEAGSEVQEQVMNVEGDPLRLAGVSKKFGAAYIDPTLAAFQSTGKAEKLKVSNIQLYTGLGIRRGGFLDAWAENKLAPLLAHIGRAFGGNPYVYSVGIRDAMNIQENEDYRNHVSGSWISSENLFVRGIKWGTWNSIVVVRVLLEFVARSLIFKMLPSAVAYLFGSSTYDASYTSGTEHVRRKREKMKKLQPSSILEGDLTAFDKMIISVSDVHRINQLVEDHSTDTEKINQVLNNYFSKTINRLPEFDELEGSKGVKLYIHLRHQFIKANKYLHQWQGKAATIEKELAAIPINNGELSEKDRIHYQNESSRLNRELERLRSEICHHQAFVDKLSACLDEEGLNVPGCIAFLKARAEITNNKQYVQERNAKTLNLETKALIPLIMAVQKQELIALKDDDTTPDRDKRKKEKNLKQAISQYRKFIIDDNYLAKRVMSSKWLEENSTHCPYLSKVNDNYEINTAGFIRLKDIINIAHTEYQNNEALSTDDIVLLGQFFGRRCVKKVMERYGLKGDGTLLHPFHMDNARALFLGAAALHNPEYLHGVPKDHLQKVLETHKQTIKLANDPNEPVKAYLRIFDNFKNYEQNEFAIHAGHDPIKFFRSIGRGFRRAYIGAILAGIKFVNNWGSANLLSVPVTGDATPIIQVLGATITGGVVDIMTPENPSFSNFCHDLQVLHAINSANIAQTKVNEQHLAEHAADKADTVVNEIMLVLHHHKENLPEFFKIYPMFQNEQQKFSEFTNGTLNESVLKEYIEQRVKQIDDWGRAEKMAVIHCMHLNTETEYSEFELTDKEGALKTFNMRSVTDTGIPLFRFNCFWPKEKTETNEPITLKIAIPEDLDTANIHRLFSPLTRLAALFRAGHETLEDGANMEGSRRADRIRRHATNIPEQQYKNYSWQNKARREDAKRRIMQAINDEIKRIESVHGPNTKINIELFGRGIAATHCHQMELYILEALAARKLQSENQVPMNYNSDPNGHASELNKGLKNGLNRSMFKEKVKFPHMALITGIRTYAFSGVGEPGHCARERAALVGYLARNPSENDPGFSVEHNIFDVEGDPSAYFGEDHADRYIDTESEAFKGKPIAINYAETCSGRGLRNNNWFYNGVMKGNFDASDLTYTTGRFSGPGRYNTNTVVISDDNASVRQVLNEQTGHKNKNKLFSEMSASLGYHARSLIMRAILMPTSLGERIMYRAYYHPITVFIGKTVRSFVYQKPFSSKYDANANASQQIKDQAHKKLQLEKRLGVEQATFFKKPREDLGGGSDNTNTPR